MARASNVSSRKFQEGSPEPRVTDLTSLLRYAKIKCRLLKCIPEIHFRVFELDVFHQTFPSRTNVFYGPELMTVLPSSFDSSLQQPVTMGCKQIEVGLCEWVPSDYVQVFSQYESVQITSIESETMPSLARFFQVRLSYPFQGQLEAMHHILQHLIAATNPTLRYFRLPVYRRETFLSQSEMNELDLAKWRIRRSRNTENDSFVVDTPDAFLTLTEHHVVGKLLCSGRWTSKKDIYTVVTHWVDEFLPDKIAYDASALYEYVTAHLDNYQMVKRTVAQVLNLLEIPTNLDYA